MRAKSENYQDEMRVRSTILEMEKVNFAAEGRALLEEIQRLA